MKPKIEKYSGTHWATVAQSLDLSPLDLKASSELKRKRKRFKKALTSDDLVQRPDGTKVSVGVFVKDAADSLRHAVEKYSELSRRKIAEGWGVGNKANDKAFDTVQIGNQEVELIHGEHPHSRQDNNTYARWPGGGIEGFNGHRILTTIHIDEENYLKESYLSGNEVRKGAHATIYFNGHPVYEVGGREAANLLTRVHQILPQLYEHPIMLFEKDWDKKLIGKQVAWKDRPGMVTYCFPDQGSIVIDFGQKDEFGQAVDVKEDILADTINWYPEYSDDCGC